MKDHPCKDCICFAICKAQMHSYLKENNRRLSALGLMQEIDPRCKLLTTYIKRTVTDNKVDQPSLIQHLHNIAMEIFN